MVTAILGLTLALPAGASASEQAAAIMGGAAAEGCGLGEEGPGGHAEEEAETRASAVPDGAGVGSSAADAASASRLAALRATCLAFLVSFFLLLLLMLLPPPPVVVVFGPLAEDVDRGDVESGRSEETACARERPSTAFVLDEDQVEESSTTDFALPLLPLPFSDETSTVDGPDPKPGRGEASLAAAGGASVDTVVALGNLCAADPPLGGRECSAASATGRWE